MIYKNSGHNSLVKLKSNKLDSHGKLNYQVEFPSGELKFVPREFLVRPDTPDVASIPMSVPDLRQIASTISDEQLEQVLHPQSLTPAEQEFLDLHHRLFHLPFSVMFRLAKAGILPKHLLRLQKRPPQCASCLFGTQHRTPWRTKSSKHGTPSALRQEDLSRAGQCVLIN